MSTPSIENPEAVYSELRSRCIQFVDSYASDLEIDRKAILQNPGVEFIHVTVAHGTHTIFLHRANSAIWPKEGDTVPYLFGKADRNHLLRETGAMLDGIKQTAMVRIVHHWAPTSFLRHSALTEVNMFQAEAIVKRYIQTVLSRWNEAKRLRADKLERHAELASA